MIFASKLSILFAAFCIFLAIVLRNFSFQFTSKFLIYNLARKPSFFVLILADILSFTYQSSFVSWLFKHTHNELKHRLRSCLEAFCISSINMFLCFRHSRRTYHSLFETTFLANDQILNSCIKHAFPFFGTKIRSLSNFSIFPFFSVWKFNVSHAVSIF